jgi:hypothetical protein
MRIPTALLASFVTLSIALPLALTSCSKDEPADNDPFDTLQACYDEHHGGDEHLPIQEAIVTCCLDHPIAGMQAPTCLDTQTDCMTHVRAALGPSILDADVNAACATYITAKHQ